MKMKELLLGIDALENQIKILAKENAFLRERLLKYEHPKNSNNSSVPLSKDENRPKPNQSLRISSGKSVGGQLGREGKT
jgi:transposase